jgi:hypothetical protein
MTGSTLRTLFDYQRLEQDPALQAVIDKVLDRYAPREYRALSDDEVALAAAGTGLPEEKKDREIGK